jgi:hypothetical protein
MHLCGCRQTEEAAMAAGAEPNYRDAVTGRLFHTRVPPLQLPVSIGPAVSSHSHEAHEAVSETCNFSYRKLIKGNKTATALTDAHTNWPDPSKQKKHGLAWHRRVQAISA